MTNNAVPVARRFLEAEFNLDAEGMIAELADDIVIEFPNAFDGMESRYEGKEVVSAMIRDWITSFWSELRSTRMDIRPEADPNRAVAEYRSEGKIASNGKPYIQKYAGVFIVRDGKLAYHAEYFDPLPVMGGFEGAVRLSGN
jgi:ketosteroid isomerase-like protein